MSPEIGGELTNRVVLAGSDGVSDAEALDDKGGEEDRATFIGSVSCQALDDGVDGVALVVVQDAFEDDFEALAGMADALMASFEEVCSPVRQAGGQSRRRASIRSPSLIYPSPLTPVPALDAAPGSARRLKTPSSR
jgi:hypothetical protein